MADIHEQALVHFKQCEDFYEPIRREAQEDLEFVAGKMWEDQAVPDGRLRLTVPLVASFLRQVTNEVRQNKPGIVVSPLGQVELEDKARIIAGLIRAIEQRSDANNEYASAFWYAAAIGEGYITVEREYITSTSFDQELLIKAVDNPFRVFLDPYCECLDGSDSNFGFIIEDVNKEFFKQRFPEAKLTKRLSDFNSPLLSAWEDKNTVRLARYFLREQQEKTLYLMKSSDPMRDPFTTMEADVLGAPGETFEVISKRPTVITVIKEYLINGMEILHETTWPGTTIPIRKVTGDHFYVSGKLVQHGSVRLAKHAQKMYNWNTSVMTELIDMAPKSSFVAAAGQIKNNPEQWQEANTLNFATLTYEPVALGGQLVPPPSRVQAMDGATFQAVSQSRMLSLEDLKMTFGIQDASLGRPGNEVSGVAILARKEQSSLSNFHYYDNLCHTIRGLGKLLVELIPAIYDTERVVSIVKPNMENSTVTLNAGRFDLSMEDRFEVTVQTGPAYGTQRQEAAEAMMNLIQAFPQAGPLVSDIMVGSMDWPEAQRVAARLRAAVPPEIRAATGEAEEEMAPAELLQEVQAELVSAKQELEKLTIELDESKAKLDIMEQSNALELTKMDQSNQIDRLKHEHEMLRTTAEIELKKMEYQLHVRELELKEKELALRATTATASFIDRDRPALPERNISGHALDGGL